jgi:hypothetical protein
VKSIFPFCQPLSLAQGTLSLLSFQPLYETQKNISDYTYLHYKGYAIADSTTKHAIRASFCASMRPTRMNFVVDTHCTDAAFLSIVDCKFLLSDLINIVFACTICVISPMPFD